MDKYDILIFLDCINSFLKNIRKEFDRKELYKKYLRMKKEWLLMKYYALRNKRSVEYNKKHNTGKTHAPIEKVLTLDRNTRYMWQMFKPIKESKK